MLVLPEAGGTYRASTREINRHRPARVDRSGRWAHVLDLSSGPRHALRPCRLGERAFCDACGLPVREVAAE
jgi:hypothetical protein